MLSVVTRDYHTVNVKTKPLINIWFDTDAALYYVLLYMLHIAYYYFRWLLLLVMMFIVVQMAEMSSSAEAMLYPLNTLFPDIVTPDSVLQSQLLDDRELGKRLC